MYVAMLIKNDTEVLIMLLKKMRVLAFVLVAALLLCPLQMVSADTQPIENKIRSKLRDEMERTTEGKLPVWVWLCDIDDTDLIRQVEESMGEQFYYPGTDDEYFAEFDRRYNKLLKEAYEKYQKEFLAMAGLSEEDLVKPSPSFPEVTVWLDKEQIYRLAEMEQVVFLSIHEELTPTPDAEIVFKYTADDALNILQACVGVTEPHISPKFDLNKDEIIDTTDALLALQSAVGLVTIYWPYGTVFE